MIVTSAAYLEARGVPKTPQMLAQHECLHHAAGIAWSLIGPHGEHVVVDVTSRLRCNNGKISYDGALAGSGLAMKSWIDVASDVEAGKLVHVLPE